MTIEGLVIVGGLALAIYSIIRWVRETPNVPPDPWSEEVEQIIQDPGTPCLCHRCLLPQEVAGRFCAACGAAVGPYNNYMPYVELFSEGEVFRAGVTERMRPSLLIIVGYVLYSLISYVIFAPIYWYFLYRNLKRGCLEHNLHPDEP
jgi:hypothetical protein